MCTAVLGTICHAYKAIAAWSGWTENTMPRYRNLCLREWLRYTCKWHRYWNVGLNTCKPAVRNGMCGLRGVSGISTERWQERWWENKAKFHENSLPVTLSRQSAICRQHVRNMLATRPTRLPDKSPTSSYKVSFMLETFYGKVGDFPVTSATEKLRGNCSRGIWLIWSEGERVVAVRRRSEEIEIGLNSERQYLNAHTALTGSHRLHAVHRWHVAWICVCLCVTGL